jgi:glutaminase
MYRSENSGKSSATYPALARVPGHLFGICVAGISGRIYRAGDTRHEFAIMSVAKPFVFALVCEVFGAERVRQELGVNATGLPFDSLASVERSQDGRSNPMVNAGAIAATSLVPGDGGAAKWRFLGEGLSRFAGRDLTLSEDVYASASATNHRNRAIANLLASRGRLACDPAEAVDLYTRQSCLLTSAEDLAVMSATLADGGINPVTGLRVVAESACRHVLAVMATAGMYETSGDWLFDVGVPGKSGIGGGIIAVSPGKGGLGTFSPLLDRAGNSVRGQLAARHLSRTLGMSLFASEPRHATPPLAEDPGFLLLELGLGQHARRQQLAELLQLGEPVIHVGWLRRGGRCLRRRGGLGVGLLWLGRVLRWRWRRGHTRRGLVLRGPPVLLPALNPAVHGAGDRDGSGGLQDAHGVLLVVASSLGQEDSVASRAATMSSADNPPSAISRAPSRRQASTRPRTHRFS